MCMRCSLKGLDEKMSNGYYVNDGFGTANYNMSNIVMDCGVFGDIVTDLIMRHDDDKEEWFLVLNTYTKDIDFDEGDISRHIPIRYCPFCGRWLEKLSDEEEA